MATTITSGFDQLKSNLEITGLQRSTVSTRQQSVRAAVEDDMTVLNSFLTGSYIRSTMIAPLSEADIDIFMILDSGYYEPNGHTALLDRVRRVLLKTYTRTPKISRNGQAVTITFNDFMVDVVPAFYRQGGGYIIPNSIAKSWISTNPQAHIDFITNENAKRKGMLIPIIKMIKGWHKNINSPFFSFYLELLAAKIFNNVTISGFPSGMRYFFDKGREAIMYTVTDPAGFGEHVYPFRQNGITDARGKFNAAYETAYMAEYYAKLGKVAQAVSAWRKIFGSYFPAYG